MCDAGGAKIPRPREQGEGVLVWSFQTEPQRGQEEGRWEHSPCSPGPPAASWRHPGRRRCAASALQATGSPSSVAEPTARLLSPLQAALHLTAWEDSYPQPVGLGDEQAAGAPACSGLHSHLLMSRRSYFKEVQLTRLFFSGRDFPSYVCLPQSHFFCLTRSF